jgi:sodium/potassium-transporting ATPase subunit alpha
MQGIVLFLVVILTVIMNYMQARQTASVMAGFRNMMPDKATVIRDGRIMERDPAELVIGDIIQLKIGKNAPADARILASTDLKADFSSLTGESDAIRLTIEAQHKEPQESKNLIFSSSGIVEGEGYGLVIRTGDATMIGKIAALASSTNTQGTTMEREIHSFVKFVAILASVSAVIFFAIGAIRSDGSRAALLNVFINAGIVVLVANVPEGLPATVTTCLTITAQRMGKRHVFIKKVDIIETLGSATVICSDKTGTLTQNKMSVVGMWYNRASNEVCPHVILPISSGVTCTK